MYSSARLRPAPQHVVRGALAPAAQRLHRHPGYRPRRPHLQPHLLLLLVPPEARRCKAAVRLQGGSCYKRSGEETQSPWSTVCGLFGGVLQSGRAGSVSMFPRLSQEVSAEMAGDS